MLTERKIREKLNLCIDPLDPTQHPEQLVNVCTGMLCSEKMDVDDAVDIGRTRTKEYEKSWPNGFLSTTKKSALQLWLKPKKT